MINQHNHSTKLCPRKPAMLRIRIVVLFSSIMANYVRSFAIPVTVRPQRRPSSNTLAAWLVAASNLGPNLRWDRKCHAATSSARYSSISSSSSGKKRVVFLGTPQVAADTLKVIHEASLQPDSGFEVTAIVTQPARRRKRNKGPEPSPVGRIAEELAIPLVWTPEKANDSTFLDELARHQPDLCITAAYGQYLPKRFLATPACGTINIHPSLLPRWRGASPVQRSLEAGDNPVGVTVLFTVSAMDAGPIIAQQEMRVDENDTATTVLPDLFQLGTQLLLEMLPNVLNGTMTLESARPQDDNQAVAASMIDSSEAVLRVWNESATICHNRFRGFSLWPQTYLWLQPGDRDPMAVKVLEARVVPSVWREPTHVVTLGPDKKSGLYVVCYDGSVWELLRVQPATRKPFPARDLQNGFPGETIRWVQPPVSGDNATAAE